LARGGRLEAALDTAVAEGALACAVQLHGLAREAFDRTRTYLGQRSQFGQTLASFQALRHRVVELGLALELTKSAIEQATGLLAEPGRHRSLSVGAAKARASDAALLVTRWAVQLHGAMGYTAECDIGLFLKAALHWSAWMGNPDAHRRSWVEAGLLEDALS
jgi:alkylation response protein AidB-like acyl-CoA dehydrogenase